MEGLTWTGIIGHSIVLVFILLLFKDEINRSGLDEDKRKISKYHRSLHFLAMTGFLVNISLALCYILVNVPYICLISAEIVMPLSQMLRPLITIYQIGRLQYTFSDSQIHSKKYGYSKWIFMVLYIYGCILIIVSSTSSWYMWDIQYTENYYCSVELSKGPLFLMIVSAYYAWDLAVLLMYIHKVCVFKRVSDKNMDKQMMKRINYVLSKIIILTLSYEILTVIIATRLFYSNRAKDSLALGLLNEVSFMIDSLSHVVMLYLMIEHNDDQYKKVLRLLNKCRLCYCFDQEREKDVEMSIEFNKGATMDTKTKNKLPMDHTTNEKSIDSEQ